MFSSLRWPARACLVRRVLSCAAEFAGTLSLSCLLAIAFIAPARAATVDIGVSAYTPSPDPILNGGTATLALTVTNNAPSAASSAPLTLSVELPSNIDFSAGTASTGCAFDLSGATKLLTCTRSAALGAGLSWEVTASGRAASAGAVSTKASVSVGSGDSDPNPANDVLSKTITVQSGADLTVAASGAAGMTGCPDCTAAAGSNVGYLVQASNAGPNTATGFQVVIDLPATTDFSLAAADGGADWTCAASGTTLTCTYKGAGVAAGGKPGAISVSGRVIRNSSGTITLGASIRTTGNATGDPRLDNNGPSQVIATITPGTDLQAVKSMLSSATSLSTFAAGEGVSLKLSAKNTGTQAATGVRLVDTIDDAFTIGTLPSACALSGRTVTCSVSGTLGAGATSSVFTIPLTVAADATPGPGSNTASVSRSAPTAGGNGSATASYTISPPFAHLRLSKSKSPGLAAAGATLTSTIKVSNDSSSTAPATGTVTVRDTLDISERFVAAGSGGNGWTCASDGASPEVVECSYAISASLARGATLPDLVVKSISSASGAKSVTNTACTGAGISPHLPADNATSCQSATSTSTVYNGDLSIEKTASAPSLAATDDSLVYTLVVRNAAGAHDTVPTVNVSDTLPVWYANGSYKTGGGAILAGATTGESCSFGQTVNCKILNLAPGASRTITITLARPFKAGTLTNTARVSTPDAIDDNAANNQASADVAVAPVADVQLSSISAAPSPVKVGVALAYTTSFRNNGPSTAAGVVLRQRLRGAGEPLRVTLSGAPSIPGHAEASCRYTTFAGAPYDGDEGIECSGFSLADGEIRQLLFSVIPVFPYPDPLPALFPSAARISTATYERDANNNAGTHNAPVEAKDLDLAVTNADPGFENLGFGERIKYQVKVQNNGPSLATRFKLTVTPKPPAQGDAANPYTMTWNRDESALAGATCAPSGADIVCWLAASEADSVLAAGASSTLSLAFETGPASNAPLGTLTFSAIARVESAETGPDPFAGDTQVGNNKGEETTTRKPLNDLFILSKTVSAGSPFSLNEPFTYTLVLGNLGKSPAVKAFVTDLLPTGLRLNGYVNVRFAGALATSSCTDTTVGARVQVRCELGTLPVAASQADTDKLVTIEIPVRAPYGVYDGAFDTDFTNTATVAVDDANAVDPVAGNNSATSAPHRIVKSSIAGSVYNDVNRNNALDAGERIGGAVRLGLYGKDAWGNDIGTAASMRTVDTSGGDFVFDKLPQAGPGGYTVVETQPAAYSDGFESAGSAGGTTPAASCEGNANCSGAPAHNTIGAIALGKNVQAGGYLFQEFGPATVGGYVWSDLNNDGKRDAGEPGIGGVQVKISGATYAGADVCALLGNACTATTNASGKYEFAIPPSAASGYTVTELAQPDGYLDGKDSKAGVVDAGSAGRSGPEAIAVGQVDPGQALGENDFGELKAGSIAGSVFIDLNGDAVRQSGELGGLFGVTITLGGNDHLGRPVCPSAEVPSCAIQTDGNGNYSFAKLAPSDAAGYVVTETLPAGLTHIGAQAGSLGGTIAGAPRASGAGVTGAGVLATSGIVLQAGVDASGYHFAESGQSLGGFVWADVNGNGKRDAGEPGIPGVQVALSGKTVNGMDVCVAIAPNPCRAVSANDGSYSFVGIPQSDANGYTLGETQPAGYKDGPEQLGVMAGAGGTNGVVSGPAGSHDEFSRIVLPVGGVGTGYNFGEQGGVIAGKVYLDVDRNGAESAGDLPLAGVTVKLSGSNDGVQTDASATTAADGSWSFGGLKAGSYTVTEIQPAIYADGAITLGSAGGNAGTPNTVTAIAVAAGAQNGGYLFGERTGTVSGTVYHDANNDGVHDAGEAGIAGVRLTLAGTAADGSTLVERSAVSGADGSYAFTGLPSADGNGYTLVQAQPAGWLDGKQRRGLVDGAPCADPACAIATANTIARIPGDAARLYTLFDFGELQPVRIAGKVYADHNANAAVDNGEGLAGVVLTLAGTDDRGQPVNASATSGADGAYAFETLRPSNGAGYTLTETHPAAYGNFPGASGTAAGTLGGSVAADAVSGIVAGSGANGSGYDFREESGAIAGTVYFDYNNNGLRDANEIPIAGVAIELADGAALRRSTVTATDGSFAFTGLAAGSYTLTETQPAGTLDGKETAGSAGGVVNIAATGADPVYNRISAIVLPAAAKASGYLFGELPMPALEGTLGGRVYADANDNGAYEAGEGIAGVTLTLSGTDRDGVKVSRTATTTADGSYQFNNVAASDPAGYTLTETQPAAYADYPGASGTVVGQAGGAAPGTAARNAVGGIVFRPRTTATGYDFREAGATLAGSVYLDADDDGRRGADEAGLSGVTLTLGGPGGIARSAVSAADGSFRFGGLPAGSYTLTETQEAAYGDGRETAGSAGGTVDNSGFGNDPAHNTIAAIVLAAGARADGYLFGERANGRASIAGRVYADDNEDRRWEAGEEIAGVTLRLSGKTASGAAFTLSTVSAADGSYRFAGLQASDAAGYAIEQQQPAGYGDYAGAAGTLPGSVSGRALGSAALNRIAAIVLGADDKGVDYDFRERGSALAGAVYVDRDDDGLRAKDEPGIGGVTVTLAGNGVSRSVVSAADGSFRFGGLAAGSYSLVETQPSGYADGRERAGNAGGTVDDSAFGSAAAQNTIGAIALPQATSADGYLFGERPQGAGLSGRVWLDANLNGAPDAGEAGMAGVTLHLDGVAADGSSVALSTITGADGGFRFTQVPPSGSAGYTLGEIQPAGVDDGVSLAGALGRPSGAKPTGSGNLDRIGGIVLKLGDDLAGYLFGETPIAQLKPPIVNGYVWLDREHNRTRPLDGSQAGLAGWSNELWQGDKLVCTANTDAQGFYQFDNLHCPGYEQGGLPTGEGFMIVFRKDGNNMPAVPVSTGNKGAVPPGGGRITGIRLAAGEAVVEQNLPLDPAGVVYDSVTRKPVAGAVVSLSGPAGFDAATQLVGGSAAERQSVGSDGMYQFLLQGAYPTGVYTLALQAPASGYLAAPSSTLPACDGTLRVGLVPDPALVQAQDGAPPASIAVHERAHCAGLVQGGARSTQYYFSFHITNGGSAPILNNHLPLDPQQAGGLVVSKTTPMVNVTRGDLVPYTVTVANRQPLAVGAVVVRDQMPPGFKYRSGSATRDGVPAEPQVDGRMLSWREPAGFAPNAQHVYKLVLMVGSGVGDGEYTNRAWADDAAGKPASTIGSATVRITPDATFDCPDVIGKVFDDRNVNGYQDEGEPGIPGVRLASPRGLLVTTDKDGRFHVACPDLPNADRGSNFVMKLDERTLPSGYRVTTENPRDVRLTRGKLAKLNFGATVHRVVRIEMADAAFEAGAERLLPDWEARIDSVVAQLRARPSVLRLAYIEGKDGAALARRRLVALEQELQARWKREQGAYPLVIETEGAQ